MAGLPVVDGQRQVAAEVEQLGVARREAAVVVEPCLADGHDLWPRGQLDDRRPRFFVRIGGDVGVDAGRGVDRLPAGQLDRRDRRCEVVTRDEDPFDARVPSRLSTAERSESNWSACTWQCESISRNGGTSG